MPTQFQMRTGPSGPRFYPSRPAGVIGWNGVGVLPLILLPADHEPGLYTVGVSAFVRTASTGGTFTGTELIWGMVDVPGLSSFAFAPAAPTTTGPKLNALRSLPSSGLSPITYQLVIAGLTGSPLIDVVAYAKWAAFNPA